MDRLEMKVEIPKAEKFNAMPGVGLEGIVEGKEIKVTGPNYLKDQGIEAPSVGKDTETATLVYIIIAGKVVGFFSFEDQPREESFETIKILKDQGIENLLLTGDNERVAKKVSDSLNMDGFIANVLPHEKQEKIKELQQKGHFVAMTGDGINDAPALAQANVGIAIGSGTDVAAETADIILVNSNPKDIATLITFGKATYRKMVQNLAWATGYNLLAIPLAAGVLYNQGIVLNPAIGAVLMSLSTIIVAVNAQLLKKTI
ncbi:MAG TPA: HAD-IC family P-type ATPase [Mariniphaga sp.]|nr:HAD-IC family P-type ATPase [Mariniphaga sp.]